MQVTIRNPHSGFIAYVPPGSIKKGEALAKTGDYAGARDALENSLKALPGQLPARLLLGNVYLSLKEGKAAHKKELPQGKKKTFRFSKAGYSIIKLPVHPSLFYLKIKI